MQEATHKNVGTVSRNSYQEDFAVNAMDVLSGRRQLFCFHSIVSSVSLTRPFLLKVTAVKLLDNVIVVGVVAVAAIKVGKVEDGQLYTIEEVKGTDLTQQDGYVEI